MNNMLKAYDVSKGILTLYHDNLNAINILKNPVQYSRTKHIDIRHHYIGSLVEDKIVYLRHISINIQLADIFTKGLETSGFETL